MQMQDKSSFSGGAGTFDSLSISLADADGVACRNQKIAMCSSMIGYCHFLEATGGEIELPESGISNIRRVRGLVEKRLNEISGGRTST